MKPQLDFEVLDRADDDDFNILKVRLFGTDHNGEAVDRDVVFPEPVMISEVHKMVAAINNGQYR